MEQWKIDFDNYWPTHEQHVIASDVSSERPHPKTKHLSEWAKNDLTHGYNVCQEIDVTALQKTQSDYWDVIKEITSACNDAREKGDPTVLGSFGSPGRAVKQIKHDYSRVYPEDNDRVQAFAGGGDTSIFVSIKNFEDHAKWGALLTTESQLGSNGLGIFPIEGGQTPMVIGAAVKAGEISNRKPYFICCNPEEQLIKIERCKEIIENPNVNTICLNIGEMVLTGSTRMQGTTVPQLIIAMAMFNLPRDMLKGYVDYYASLDMSAMHALTEAEADIIGRGDYINYICDDFAMAMLANTTEIAPTYGQPFFENYNPDYNPVSTQASPVYVTLKDFEDAASAQQFLFGGKPHTLEPEDWPKLGETCSQNRLNGFDVSKAGFDKRSAFVAPAKVHKFYIGMQQGVLKMEFIGERAKFDIGRIPLPLQSLFFKMVINIHTTLIMGRLGHFQGNKMKDARFDFNGKLITRGTNYLLQEFDEQGLSQPTRKEATTAILKAMHADRQSLNPVDFAFKNIRTLKAP